jgi:hypothetical protein
MKHEHDLIDGSHRDQAVKKVYSPEDVALRLDELTKTIRDFADVIKELILELQKQERLE